MTADNFAEIERAKRYYYAFIAAALGSKGQFQKRSTVYTIFFNQTGIVRNTSVSQYHALFLTEALEDFVTNGWVDSIEDEYADAYLARNEKTDRIEQEDKDYQEIRKR